MEMLEKFENIVDMMETIDRMEEREIKEMNKEYDD